MFQMCTDAIAVRLLSAKRFHVNEQFNLIAVAVNFNISKRGIIIKVGYFNKRAVEFFIYFRLNIGLAFIEITGKLRKSENIHNSRGLYIRSIPPVVVKHEPVGITADRPLQIAVVRFLIIEGLCLFLKKVMSLVERNVENPDFSVDMISETLGMSSTHLYRKLKAITGQSTRDIINNYRMQKAANMLKNKDGNITEIMYAVGYTSLSSFSKSFKAKFGVSPKGYK
ncbi:MAG: hypothetical protein PWQ17_1980 [Anaerophaga sp.]|nr:hypothetical protein [Anaerophaga sp.]